MLVFSEWLRIHMSAVTESTLKLDLLFCRQPQQQKIKSGMYITIGPISMMRWVDDISIYPFPYLSIHLVIYHTIWVCSHRNKTRFLKEAFTRGLILCEACWNLRKIKISNAFACSSYWVIKAGEGTGHNEHVSNWDIDHSSMVDATNTPFRSASFTRVTDRKYHRKVERTKIWHTSLLGSNAKKKHSNFLERSNKLRPNFLDRACGVWYEIIFIFCAFIDNASWPIKGGKRYSRKR